MLKYVNDITLVILIGSSNLLAPSASLAGFFLGKKRMTRHLLYRKVNIFFVNAVCTHDFEFQ